MNLNKLIDSMKSNPDMAFIKQDTLPTMLQSLYASTGCDYIIPSLQELEKEVFLKHSTHTQNSSVLTAP